MVIHIKWDNDKKGIVLPVNPQAFKIANSMNNTSVMVHNLGEINLKGKRGLWSITLESFFPSQKYSFAMDSYHDPYQHYIKMLKARFQANTTLHLVITETNINMYCTIESFEYGHEEKNMDVAYSLTLKEYREEEATPAGKPKRVAKGKGAASYKWKKGDTWPKVTKMKLGSSKKWKAVRKKNFAVIKKARRKHPKKKEKQALIGYKVVVKA